MIFPTVAVINAHGYFLSKFFETKGTKDKNRTIKIFYFEKT